MDGQQLAVWAGAEEEVIIAAIVNTQLFSDLFRILRKVPANDICFFKVMILNKASVITGAYNLELSPQEAFPEAVGRIEMGMLMELFDIKLSCDKLKAACF